MYAVNRVFSSLKNSFYDQQSRVLEDYVEFALMLSTTESEYCSIVVLPLFYSTSEVCFGSVFSFLLVTSCNDVNIMKR